jgi:hypothetical protein
MQPIRLLGNLGMKDVQCLTQQLYLAFHTPARVSHLSWMSCNSF